jgi:hypothetical protein
MDKELIRIFSEELRETKKLVVETSRMADAAVKEADAAMKKADAAMLKADAAWELVIITRNQVKEEIAYLKLPLWKKFFRSGNSS